MKWLMILVVLLAAITLALVPGCQLLPRTNTPETPVAQVTRLYDRTLEAGERTGSQIKTWENAGLLTVEEKKTANEIYDQWRLVMTMWLLDLQRAARDDGVLPLGHFGLVVEAQRLLLVLDGFLLQASVRPRAGPALPSAPPEPQQAPVHETSQSRGYVQVLIEPQIAARASWALV